VYHFPFQIHSIGPMAQVKVVDSNNFYNIKIKGFSSPLKDFNYIFSIKIQSLNKPQKYHQSPELMLMCACIQLPFG
jgi:hypothetical protein